MDEIYERNTKRVAPSVKFGDIELAHTSLAFADPLAPPVGPMLFSTQQSQSMDDILSASKKPVSSPRTRSPEEIEWGRVAPVGREFGSPDFDRLMALDAAAAEALGDWQKIRPWLDEPNDQLDGQTPENAARSPGGLVKVLGVLKAMR